MRVFIQAILPIWLWVISRYRIWCRSFILIAMSMSISPLKLFGDCERITAHLIEGLASTGCKIIRSFDLQKARKAHSAYHCPRHGDAACDCQMIFLLVYFPDGNSPSTIVVHGYDGITSFNWDDGLSEQKSEMLLKQIRCFGEKQEELFKQRI